ncbi:uncharacterized protein EMH_0002260 [Eimeria mitis]|uniref:Uncharacterized protein n=1 Tax=Eimeria mitis TaxID=44415 RepID=U6JXP2_9EIME|nr:uncharacterized protein EMH_0002260 [Eimeria mitis]CDJ28817.1 hypothetical protein EMH_0002260 [Eimeria mitis]
MGLMEERASSSSERNWSSRVAELVSMLSETAAARESRQERLPVAAQLHLGRQLLERQTVFQPQSSELVALLTRGQSPGGAFRPDGQPLALNPDSWLEEIPSIGGRPEGPEGAGPSSVTAGKSKTGKLLNRRSLRRRRPGGLKKLHSLEDIKEHAYVRLPVLEEGVVPRYIRVPALFDKGQRKFSPHPYLLTLRRLFAKRRLNQQDADILMHAVERLASATLFRGEKVISTPSAFHVVEVLGDYFMIFDAIVCASQVMGKYMQLPLWWGKFTAKVHTSYTVSSAGGNGKQISTFHSNLAARLIAALNIYKRGERPPAEEVFALKALLFCAPMGYHRFKGPKWDPWRKDGDCS